MNVLKIIRNSAGEAVGLNITGFNLDANLAFHQATIGELTDGTATITWGGGYDADTRTFAVDTHADDNGTDGATAHAELVRLTTHTTHPHGDMSIIPLWQQGLNALGVSIANIFGRLEVLEANNPPPIEFDSWVVQNQELRLNVGGSTGDDCIIDMSHGYTLCPSRIAGQPADSLERMVSILVNGTVSKLHVFSWGDTGSIADAVRANRDTQTRGTPRPTGTT